MSITQINVARIQHLHECSGKNSPNYKIRQLMGSNKNQNETNGRESILC